MVAIMVTLILMIVISLIVLGFAQIARRNQRQALDRQLSTQAFYAAETGINDVRALIDTATQANQSIPAKTGCGTGTGAEAVFYGGLNPVLDANADVRYTCLMVDPTPEALRYNVGTTSVIVPVMSANGSIIRTVSLEWEAERRTNSAGNVIPPTSNCPTTASGVFATTGSWQCGYGVLRVDLVPTDGAFDYAGLQNRTMTTFLVPIRGGGGSTSVAYAAGGNNNRLGVTCTDANCSFDLQLNSYNSNQYFMRISSLYQPASLIINAMDGSGNLLRLANAQAVIDSTGRAQDVLRRVQVHVPLNGPSQNQLSDFVMQTTDAICKRFAVANNYFDTQVTGVTSTNPLCQP